MSLKQTKLPERQSMIITNKITGEDVTKYEQIWKLMDELKDNGYFTESENLYDKYSK